MPVILEAIDGQQIHHKLLGADVQVLPGEPMVRLGRGSCLTYLLSAPQSGLHSRGSAGPAAVAGTRGTVTPHCLGQGLVQMTLPCLPIPVPLATLLFLTYSPLIVG